MLMCLTSPGNTYKTRTFSKVVTYIGRFNFDTNCCVQNYEGQVWTALKKLTGVCAVSSQVHKHLWFFLMRRLDYSSKSALERNARLHVATTTFGEGSHIYTIPKHLYYRC